MSCKRKSLYKIIPISVADVIVHTLPLAPYRELVVGDDGEPSLRVEGGHVHGNAVAPQSVLIVLDTENNYLRHFFL